jgi:predicted PurR-regulated permease PerM
MMPNILANWQRFFVLLGGAGLTILCLHAAKAILLPFVLALLLTFILNPVVSMLQRLRIGRVFSVLLATSCTFTFLGVVVWIFTPQLADLARELPRHKATIVQKKKITDLKGQEEQLLGSLISFAQDVSDEIRKEKTTAAAGSKPEPMNVVVEDPAGPLKYSWITVLVGPLLDNLLVAVLIVALVVLMLIHRENLRNRILRLVGQGQLISTTRVLDDVAHRISSFLFTQAVINITFGTILGVGLFFIGVPYAPFFALLAGFLRFVPYIGTAGAALLLIVCEFAFFPGWTECLLTLGLLVFLELLTAYVAEPLLLGRKTGISPIALLMAAVFWSWLWGPVGLLLSTPMTVCLIVLGKYVPNLAFLNILLGDEPVLTEQFRYYQRLLARDQDEAVEVVETYLQNHSVEAVYDEILVPALVLAKRDAALGELTNEHERWMHQIIRETLEESVNLQQDHEEEAGKPERPMGLVLGCVAHDDADELALQMLGGLLRTRAQELKVISSKALSSEIAATVEKEQPTAVVIASLPAGGLTHSYYLCKKLRSRFPRLRIILGRWGQTERAEQTRQRAVAEGANYLHTRILETADAIDPAAPIAATGQPATSPGERREEMVSSR